jgi:hypothetical protein
MSESTANPAHHGLKPGECFMCGRLGCDCEGEERGEEKHSPLPCEEVCATEVRLPRKDIETRPGGTILGEPFKFCITGFNYNRQLNGTYVLTESLVNGRAAYKLHDSADGVWCCADRNNQWNMQTAEDKGEASGWACTNEDE